MHKSPSKEQKVFIPAVLDFSVTDYCNANCGFCGFSRDKMRGQARSFADSRHFIEALPILKQRGIRYLNFQGGEPLLHPQIIEMVTATRAAGIKPSLITNGFKLPDYAHALAKAGLQNLYISIDSADLAAHAPNRGLRRVRDKIAEGIACLAQQGIPVVASVTVSKLVDVFALPKTLQSLGFEGVNFSYPRKEAFDSNSRVYAEDSPLVDFSPKELSDVLEHIIQLKQNYPVLNPELSIRDIQRHIRGEPERFQCVGGYKYFYMDWALNVWRCEAWHAPLGSVFELANIPDQRDPCTACIMSCYRDASALMHSAVALKDAAQDLRHGNLLRAFRRAFNMKVVHSAHAGLSELALLSRLARRKPQSDATKNTGAEDLKIQMGSRFLLK